MGPLGRVLLCALFVLCLTSGSAWGQATPGQTFTVNTTADGTDLTNDGACNTTMLGPPICTLRAAIQEANRNGATADTIVVPAGTYQLTLSGGAENSAANGDLDINTPMTIDGAGARTTIVQQTTADRVFEVLTTSGLVQLERITITGGNPDGGNGAGLRNTGPTTQVVDAAVRGNVGDTATAGGGIENTSTGGLTIDRTLVQGNSASGFPGGGGILNAGNLTLVTSTVDGNTATSGAGMQVTGGTPKTEVSFATFTGNTANTGSVIQSNANGGSTTFRDSIVGPNQGTGTNCSTAFTSQGHNIDTGSTCGFTNTAAGDRPNTDPVLGPLVYSRAEDQTETRVPQSGSPAIDGGDTSGCPATDQRGLPRPSGAACDIGAVEAQAAGPAPAPKPASLVLDPPSANRTPGDDNVVTATVRNDNGTPAAGQSVRYEISGATEGAGAVDTDASGVARISWEGVHEGTDVIKAYVDTNRDLTPAPDEPTGQASVVWALPTPQLNRTVNIEPVSGRVRITVKGGTSKVGAAGATQLLTEARQVPLSTVVDVRKGRVLMSSAANNRGGVQKGEFYSGVFTTRQTGPGSRAVTELRMSESLVCPKNRRGKLIASRARSRRLWGNARGRFRTRGRHSTATVRGTIWLQKDKCDSTTTVVRQGTVTVRDFAKRKNVKVKAGRRYTARRARRR